MNGFREIYGEVSGLSSQLSSLCRGPRYRTRECRRDLLVSLEDSDCQIRGHVDHPRQPCLPRRAVPCPPVLVARLLAAWPSQTRRMTPVPFLMDTPLALYARPWFVRHCRSL